MNEEINRKPSEIETEFVVTLASMILGVVGCYGILIGMLSPNSYPKILFYSVFILQAMITIFQYLKIIPFGVWGWIK